MCGVIGVSLSEVTKPNLELIKEVFHQSMIRGKHATGLSYVKDNKIKTIKNGVPVTEFFKTINLSECINEDGSLYLIGHIRYSTSDIRYNQPFSNGNISICHNGVISQEDPSEWSYKCQTSNDSEMILKSIEHNNHPLEDFADKSMSVCSISSDKTLSCFRNHERPLWYSLLSNGIIFTSTKDIAIRSGLNSPKKCDMFVEYKYKHSLTETKIVYNNYLKDLQ